MQVYGKKFAACEHHRVRYVGTWPTVCIICDFGFRFHNAPFTVY